VIGDAPEIRRAAGTVPPSHEYRVIHATTAPQGLKAAKGRPPNLIVIALERPSNELEVLRHLRAQTTAPLLVLSSGRPSNGDDHTLDLLAHLGRAWGRAERICHVRDLEIDRTRRRASVKGQVIRLTPIEYRLLTTLAEHRNEVLTHKQLFEEAWGREYAETQNVHYLHVYVAQLRRKIESDPARPGYIVTEPGVGYRLADEADA
jgi:two-component system KDP operon response regulator KdpE